MKNDKPHKYTEKTALGFETPVDESLREDLQVLWLNKPEPTMFHSEVLKRYWTKEKLKQLVGHMSDDEYEESLQDLIDEFSIDGYKYAKNLEDNCWWSITANMVNVLDCIYPEKQYKECLREWQIVNKKNNGT